MSVTSSFNGHSIFRGQLLEIKKNWPNSVLQDLYVTSGLPTDEENENHFQSTKFVKLKLVLVDLSTLGMKEILFDWPTNRQFETISDLFANADWYQRECAEFYGLPLVKENSKSLYLPHDHSAHGMDKTRFNHGNVNETFKSPTSILANHSSHDWKTKIIGPVFYGENNSLAHYSDSFSYNLSNGPFRIILRSQDEIVRTFELEIGFSFKNIESILIGKPLEHVPILLDRLFFWTPHWGQYLFSSLIEQKLQVKLPNRVKAMRMLFLELVRINSHLRFLNDIFKNLGDQNFEKDVQELRHNLLKLLQAWQGEASGGSFSKLIIPGGFYRGLPKFWFRELQIFLKLINKRCNNLLKKFAGSQAKPSILGAAPLSRLSALHFNISGPNARASGMNLDARKSKPFFFYNELDFEIPIGQVGHTHDRIYLRLWEILESSRILAQIIDQVPEGALRAFEEDDIEAKLRSQGPVIHEEVFLEGPEGFYRLELLLTSDNETKNQENGYRVSRIRINTPMHNAAQALGHIMSGVGIDCVETAFKSFNLNFWEIDK